MPTVDPGGNFNEELNIVTVNGVHAIEAKGPLSKSVVEVTEMCVWVLQRQDAGLHDAIANAMGPETKLAKAPMPGMPAEATVAFDKQGTDDANWTFLLTDRESTESVDFRAGSATAIAIGVFLTSQRTQRAFVWSEPVRLVLPGSAA
jgi:hypothetical protein